MNGKRIVTTIDLILNWITRLAYINLLWILFSIMGLIIGGVFPATVAVLGVSRKWLLENEDIPVWKTFIKIYKQEFRSANIIGWLLTLIGIVFYINYKILLGIGNELWIVVPFSFYLLLFFYLIVIIWSFPLLVHYKGSWLQHIKNAVIIGLTKIHYTITIGLILFSIIYFSLDFPGLILFFSFSIALFSCMWFSLRAFQKVKA